VGFKRNVIVMLKEAPSGGGGYSKGIRGYCVLGHRSVGDRPRWSVRCFFYPPRMRTFNIFRTEYCNSKWDKIFDFKRALGFLFFFLFFPGRKQNKTQLTPNTEANILFLSSSVLRFTLTVTCNFKLEYKRRHHHRTVKRTPNNCFIAFQTRSLNSVQRAGREFDRV
jgi:hypothetical protein